MSFSDRFITFQVFFFSALLVLFVTYKNINSDSKLPFLGKVNDFALTAQDNSKITLKELKGSVWVADFVFTTCSGICPAMTKHMSALSRTYAVHKDIKMVSISVNPENDTPEVLKNYAKKYNANERWIFLTGPRDDIQKLAVQSFKIGDMKEIMFHSAMFVLVDRNSRIRGYYDSGDQARLDALNGDVASLRKELNLPLLPSINASLNGLSGLLLFFGFMTIRRKNKEKHQKLMTAAICSSGLFLMCYLYYHATTHIITRYQGEGLLWVFYQCVLWPHTLLAAVIVPFIFIAVKHAIQGDFAKHTRITKWLYPAWMYVSVTGVIVYLMLYVLKPA